VRHFFDWSSAQTEQHQLKVTYTTQSQSHTNSIVQLTTGCVRVKTTRMSVRMFTEVSHKVGRNRQESGTCVERQTEGGFQSAKKVSVKIHWFKMISWQSHCESFIIRLR
jgi:hypothetical protein